MLRRKIENLLNFVFILIATNNIKKHSTMNLLSKASCLIFLLSICLFSCKAPIDSKENYLKEYKSFVEEIKEHKDEYSSEKWKEKDIEFKKFSSELYQKFESELGFLEQARIAKYAIMYGSTRGVNALNAVLEDEEIEKSIEEFKTLWDDDLKDDLELVIKDVKKVWDEDLKDELEGKLEELKDVLEDEDFQDVITKKIEELKFIVEEKELEDELKEVTTKLEKILKSIEKKLDK